MDLQAKGRRRRRAPLLAAAAIFGAILIAGAIIELAPESGPKAVIGAAPETASESAPRPAMKPQDDTPFAKLFAQGIEAMQAGDAHAAAVAFDQARAINPHISEAHVNLGFAYLAMERPREAVTAFDRALTIDKARTNAYYGLGAALDASGDREAAMGAMRTYVHLSKEDDPFRTRAMAAIWEWEAERKAEAQKADGSQKAEESQKADESHKDGEQAVAAAAPPDSAKPAGASASPPAPAPLPGISESPDALKAPEGMISIVNVWASWCGPCRDEMPSLQAFVGALDPARYRLVGLNIDRDRDFAREFIRDVRISFPNVWDGEGVFARERYGVDSYPQTLFLDANGAVLARVVGSRDWPVETAGRMAAEILAAGRKERDQK